MSEKYWPISFTEFFAFDLRSEDIASYMYAPGCRERYKRPEVADMVAREMDPQRLDETG